MSEAILQSEAGRIARFMGLPKWASISDLQLVDRVAKGLPTSTVETIVRKIDPRGEHLDIFDIIPRASFYRRKDEKKPLTKEQSEKVFALTKVFSEAVRLYGGDSDLAAAFLSRPHALLEGRKPIDVARDSTVGADLVLTLLARADAGVAV